MRVLLTGGTGFLGRPLCARLLSLGHDVTVLTRRPEVVQRLLGSRVSAMTSLSGWHPHERYDAVVNLAGESLAGRRWSGKQKEVLRESRVALTSALVEKMGAAAEPPAVFLSGSAVGLYGDRGDLPLTENSPPGGDFLAGLCSAWERAAEGAMRYGTRVCLLRTGVVLHPSGGALAKMLPAFRAGIGARLGRGSQFMSWITLEDHLRLVEELLQNGGAQGPFNLTAPEPVTNEVFTQTLSRVLRRPALLALPGWALRVALGEMASVLLASQRAVPGRALEMGFSFHASTLKDALAAMLSPPPSLP